MSMMDIKRLIQPAPDWTNQTWAARFDAAASLLFLHGYIPQAQRLKITRKIEKLFADAIASGEIVERVAEAITERAQVGTHPQGGDSLEAPAPLSDAVAEGHAPLPLSQSITPPEADSYAAWQQKRGMLADKVDWAINEYDEFMKDDAYDSQRVLDRIVAGLRETSEALREGERS